MNIAFDPAKDAANVEKHGISLARFVEMEIISIVEDDRFQEPRLRAYGLIDDLWFCCAIAMRGNVFRIISLRRAHRKEIDRHV